QLLVTLPQDEHTASWQTLGLGSAAVSVQSSFMCSLFRINAADLESRQHNAIRSRKESTGGLIFHLLNLSCTRQIAQVSCFTPPSPPLRLKTSTEAALECLRIVHLIVLWELVGSSMTTPGWRWA
ncbi:hypothetical protein GOODEAATRI_030868, partial [Goodea atripinnis]